MSTTIGVPYDDLRPHVLRQKKSFFQRLNETHDQLLSHMRSLKEDPVLSVKQSAERTRASSTTSLTSVPESDRESSQDTTRCTEFDLETPISSGFLSPPISPVEGSFFPIQQFLMPMDRKPSKEFIQGMQGYVHWKQATYESTLSPPISPPQTPQSSYSWSSSRSTRSEMSDEEMDDWLDRPMDADVHRFRKISASSLEESSDSDSDDEKKIHVIQEQPEDEDSASREERQHISAMWRETWCMRDSQADISFEDQIGEIAPEATLKASPKSNKTKNRESRLLSLPDELLRTIALHVPQEHTQPFRLSCAKFDTLIQTPLCST
ncbi:uncharacterized protein J4E87_007906 [Alternaria ethzedia]|uniref:uncharacterized protein n=1 Tax=Alternaria ethzedia TaxID=181014 RepID=UPI0020C34AAC|nr:uncharacterized protein J4E87_007906 [Alternaria ethzedia]KAI4618238.1 hypothetical protein J4E87_007906 [Alternaria ethzedia]